MSYITDTREVYQASGAGVYLGKYLQKQEGQREDLERMGFIRRWSRTNGWPADDLLRSKGSELGVWKKVTWTHGLHAMGMAAIEKSMGHPLLERVGGKLYLAMVEKAGWNGLERRLERTVRGASIP